MDLSAVRAALEQLPETCRYHGDQLDPPTGGWPREACCDTGVPALRRRKAMEALDYWTPTPIGTQTFTIELNPVPRGQDLIDTIHRVRRGRPR